MLSIKAPLNCRVRPQAVARAPRQAFRVVCHGHGHGGAGPAGTAVLTEKDRGFIAEMRKVAMKLHTKDQSPKEGGKDAPKPGPWTPTRTGYLRFLAESKVVYDTLETLVHTRDEYAMLRGTGLERAHGLAEDLTWFQNTYQLSPPELTEDGP
ncbi:Heme oxygenase 3, chloroplastic, partial [Tetrabaena socialis]